MNWDTCRQNLSNWVDKGTVQLNKLISTLKDVALQAGSNVNADEIWESYRTHNGHKKTYMWCLVNKKAGIIDRYRSSLLSCSCPGQVQESFGSRLWEGSLLSVEARWSLESWGRIQVFGFASGWNLQTMQWRLYKRYRGRFVERVVWFAGITWIGDEWPDATRFEVSPFVLEATFQLQEKRRVYYRQSGGWESHTPLDGTAKKQSVLLQYPRWVELGNL